MADVQPTTPIRWEVFPGLSRGMSGRMGWFSYVEDDQHYLGGDWHATQAEAEAYAQKVAKEAQDAR